MKNYVFPSDSVFLQTYGTTASTVFDPLYRALSKRSDWQKVSFSEPTIDLPAGKYALCEDGSSRILSFLGQGRTSTADEVIRVNAGESLRLVSQTGMPPFYLRVTRDVEIGQHEVTQLFVEFLPIEAHDFKDTGRLAVVRTQAFDYCADERLSKIASTILDARNITNKTNLVQTLTAHMGKDGFIPPTYQIQFGGWYGEVPCPEDSKVWFLKNSTQDRASGIELLSNPLEALNRVDRTHRYVVQPSLENPHLIDSKKYDLRFYVVLAHDNERRWFGLFNKALMRKCPLAYQPEALEPARQLSNYLPTENLAEDFNAKKYGIFDSSKPDYDVVFEQVQKIVEQIAQATRFNVGARRQGRRFHLFSLDFALDMKLRLWLFEANSSPGLDIEHAEVQAQIIAPMVDGLVDVAISPLLEGRVPKTCDGWCLSLG